MRRGTIAFLDGAGVRRALDEGRVGLLAAWGKELPLLVVVAGGRGGLIKSFRNLDRVLVTVPAELEVAAVVWARSLLVTEVALELVGEGR